MKLPISLLLILIVSLGLSGKPQTNNQQRTSGQHSEVAPSETIFNLLDFGAQGDGITDAGPALQSALDALAEAGGGTLFVPAGRYAIVTPVHKHFTGSATVTILGVESFTPIPPPNAIGLQLTHGLDLTSEFEPRTGTQGIAINISGLQALLIKDIGFVGTPDVYTDATITLALADIWEATIKHCEFYGLLSLVDGGAIVQVSRSHFTLEESAFLGSSCNSGYNTSVVQNIEWKGIAIVDNVFADYGRRPNFYGKVGISPSFSWVNVSNAAVPESSAPRREAVIRNVFFDEGALAGISSRFAPPSAPIDLLYISGIYLNVSNLGTWGNYIYGPANTLIENAHYGWSHNADSAINLLGVGNAIVDQAECGASADRIRADSATGSLTVIDSVYNHLDSLAQTTRVITTTTPDEDPVQYVRQGFQNTLGREPDAAAHYFWSDRQLHCGEDLSCIADQRAALNAYLNTTPSPDFSISGQVSDNEGVGLPGVVVTLAGSQSVATQTDSDGRYWFGELPTSGSYTITPDRPHYAFDQPSQNIITPSGDRNIDFVGTRTQNVTVRIVDPGGSVVPETTVLLSGSSEGSGVTNLAGEFTFESLPADGSYLFIPERQNYTFSPTSLEINGLDSDKTVTFTGTPPKQFEFTEASYSVTEGTRTMVVTVRRTGNTSAGAEVTYSALDGSADQRGDVIPIVGRLSFAPAEASKTFIVFITDDSYVEGDENLMLMLSEPTGGTLGDNSSAMLAIVDNDNGEPAPNPVDDAEFFVRQQYRDFLNRAPDPEGLAFWSGQIVNCGSDAGCIADRRMNVSAAFFLSIEFQQTGFLVYRLYRASFGQAPQHLQEFLLDTRTIGEGVVVNAPGWQDLLEAKKIALIEDFVERPAFVQEYPPSLPPNAFVNLLNAKIGGALSAEDFAAAVAEFQGAATSESVVARARALRRIAENPTFSQHELNSAFVLMQYFGYLQRNPYETPDTNLDGYDFWLHKLEEFGGDFRRAEMVKSFLVSSEYRARFGAP